MLVLGRGSQFICSSHLLRHLSSAPQPAVHRAQVLMPGMFFWIEHLEMWMEKTQINLYPPKFNSLPLKSDRNPTGTDRLPTTIFQGLC